MQNARTPHAVHQHVHHRHRLVFSISGFLILFVAVIGCDEGASGVSEAMRRDAVKYVGLDKEMHQERRLVMTGDNPREISRHDDRVKALVAEMKAIKAKYETAGDGETFEKCVSDTRTAQP